MDLRKLLLLGVCFAACLSPALSLQCYLQAPAAPAGMPRNASEPLRYADKLIQLRTAGPNGQCLRFKVNCTKTPEQPNCYPGDTGTKWIYTITANCTGFKGTPNVYTDVECCTKDKCNAPDRKLDPDTKIIPTTPPGESLKCYVFPRDSSRPYNVTDPPPYVQLQKTGPGKAACLRFKLDCTKTPQMPNCKASDHEKWIYTITTETYCSAFKADTATYSGVKCCTKDKCNAPDHKLDPVTKIIPTPRGLDR